MCFLFCDPDFLLLFQFDSYPVYAFGNNHLKICSIKGIGMNIVGFFLKNIAIYRGKSQLNMNSKVHPLGEFCSNRNYRGMKIRPQDKSIKWGG